MAIAKKKTSLLRKKCERNQGLKILTFGEDGSGKSVYGLSFPKVAVLDAESKLGVYENDPQYGANIEAIADSSNYEDCIDVMKEVIEGKICDTAMIDSETAIYKNVQVGAMELEEQRATSKGQDPSDATVSQRGWGKIDLLFSRLTGLKTQASAQGVTLIVTSHKKDINKKVGNDNVKVGEKADLRTNSGHIYDVILRFYKDKNIGTGEIEYKAEVVKDTTRTFKVGDIITSPTYENTFKNYIETKNKLATVSTSYDKSIDNTIISMKNEEKNFNEVVSEFEGLFSELKAKDANNVEKVKTLLKEHGITNFKKQEYFEQLKVVLSKMKEIQ